MKDLILGEFERIMEERDIDLGSLSSEEEEKLFMEAERNVEEFEKQAKVDRIADEADNLRKANKAM